MIFYDLFAEHRYDCTCGPYETYGIAAYRAGRVVRSIGDISTDRGKVVALTELFNAERLSLTHFREAVEDFLIDFEV